MKQKQVWLDLEDTIIESWDSYLHYGTLSTNFYKVKTWLIDNNIKTVNIFSAAIHNETDKLIFKEQMKTELENQLSVSIDLYPSVYEVLTIAKKFDKIHYEMIFDFIQINGKLFSFFKYHVINSVNEHHVLIDDCVDDWLMENKRTGLKLEFINAIRILE